MLRWSEYKTLDDLVGSGRGKSMSCLFLDGARPGGIVLQNFLCSGEGQQ